jgi:nicotinamide mononucleotide transporter
MFDFFIDSYATVSWAQIGLEFCAFVFGIISVFCAKKENIWVYPTGLVSTIITVYLLFIAQYFADMTINIYYSVMSIYGWILWSRKENAPILKITRTNFNQKKIGFLLFTLTMLVTFGIYKYFDYEIKIPNYIDIFTSGIFFTAMWFMATKKIENWILWIIGDSIAVPLFAYRGLGMLALQYLIFTILAAFAYLEWKRVLEKSLQK